MAYIVFKDTIKPASLPRNAMPHMLAKAIKTVCSQKQGICTLKLTVAMTPNSKSIQAQDRHKSHCRGVEVVTKLQLQVRSYW